MYRCEDCGEIFDFPKIIYENHGEFWGMPAYEKWAVCPNCHDNNFDEYYSDDDTDEDEESEEW